MCRIHPGGQIVHPCYHGAGFSNCSKFVNGWEVSWPPPIKITGDYSCPRCHHREGGYNMNQFRLVKKVSHGFKLGTGPARRDPGCEFKCGCVVM
ncbi:hypothetical protein B0H67DRAFT_477070 [Lasiosphaeris hirsuta]|uniref:Uncharacterized protein n=1 Tax=Lasiosphaeris hirsuta TaxID=260670 RepID=A0AA40BAQ4_9PEZI|nr:hypothetical protein B0H67DRAFT_477070 [Lasiosphaeris hirsuta]